MLTDFRLEDIHDCDLRRVAERVNVCETEDCVSAAVALAPEESTKEQLDLLQVRVCCAKQDFSWFRESATANVNAKYTVNHVDRR